MPSQLVVLEVLHDQVLGSLGRRLLMTSTQEPNTMVSRSVCSLYLLKKMENKINCSNIFWGESMQVLSKNHFFFITGVRVKFQFERLQNKLRSSTFDNCEITAWSFESTSQYFK